MVVKDIYLLTLNTFVMSSQMLLRENLERRIREIERRINELRRKYGMDFDEFFEATEDLRKFEQLMRKGFDPDEILRDISEWENLLDELEQLKEKVKHFYS